MALLPFPDTENKDAPPVETRGPQGPIDTTMEAVVGTNTYNQNQSNEAAKFGDTPGQLIVNPLKTENVFNYGEYFNEDFFNQSKELGSEITSMVLPNGETIDFDPNEETYQDKVDMLNLYQPRMLISRSQTDLDERGNAKINATYNVDEYIDGILRDNIDDKITSEIGRIPPNILPNPFIDAPAIFNLDEYYKKNEKGEYLPDYSESSGRKAKAFLSYLDSSFPKMSSKTKAQLINRNVYGISDMKILAPEAETGTGSGKVLGEKIITLVQDAPRALVDLAMSIVGVGGELAYDGLKNGINLAGVGFGKQEAILTDQHQFLYGTLPNPFSETGRDLIRSYLGPDAAQSYRLTLAKDGILVTETQAYEILNYTADSADKVKLLTPMLVGEAMLISKIGDKGRKTFMDEMKKFEAENSSLKGGELVQAFLKHKESSLPVYKSIKNFLNKNKLKDAGDIAESSKPLQERSLYIEANQRVKETTGALDDAIEKTIRQAQEKSLKDKTYFRRGAVNLNTPEINRLKALKVESHMMVRFAEQMSGTPKYVRDMYRDNTLFASIAAVTGQQLQQLGVPPEVGYLVGMGTMMVANRGRDINIKGYSLRDMANSASYNPTNILTVMRKSNLFDKDMTSQEMLQLLKNPKLEGLGRQERKLAIELSERINSLVPEVRDQIVANIMYYKNMREELVATGNFGNGDVLEASFGDMSGMAFYDALEDSFTYSMSQSKVFDPEITETLTKIQLKRTQLMENLESHVKDILQTEGLDKNDPAIIKFVGRIQETLSNAQVREDGMRAIKDSFIKSKTMLLQNMLHGSADPDVQKAIKAEYGDVIEMAESLVDDITTFKLDGNKVDIAAARENLLLAEQAIQKEFLAQIANKKLALRNKTGKIPSIVDSSSGEKVIELAKYNDENASLARMIMVNKKIAKARARIPFQEFDEKYSNIYGTDASELGFKILNDIRLSSGDRASKGLVSQLMRGGDEKKIFNVLNKGAGETLDNMQKGSSNNFDFRESYTQIIRDKLPDNLKSVNITDLDIISYIKNVEGDIDVGIALNMTDSQNLYSALNAKAYKAFRANDTGLAGTYGEYAKEADGLFEKVVDMNGTPISDDAQTEILKEIKAMREGYKNNYTVPFLTQGSRTSRWSNPELANVDSAQTPGAKQWTAGNEPSTWFNLRTVSKLDDTDIIDMNRDFRTSYGKYNEQTKSYEIDVDSDGFKALKEIATIKFEKEVARLMKTISDPKQLQDAVDNLGQKTFDLFKSSEGGTESAFRYDHSLNAMTDLGAIANRDSKVKAALDKEMVPFNKRLRKDGEIVYRAMRESGENIKMLQKVAETPTNKAFFERYIVTANGPNDLKALKLSVTGGKNPTLSVKEFDDLVKEMVSTHISALVVRPTGSTSMTKDAGGKFIAIKDTEFDSKSLNELLSGDSPAMANLIRSGYLDDDHVKNLTRINEFMSNRKKLAQRRSDLKFTGEPRGLSIESYISRFYSISRGVVSPKYVATEAIIQNVRMAEHRMLKEMIMKPEVASILAELVVDGKKFTEQKEQRLREIFTTMAINAYASQAINTEDRLKSGASLNKMPEYDFSKFQQQENN